MKVIAMVSAIVLAGSFAVAGNHGKPAATTTTAAGAAATTTDAHAHDCSKAADKAKCEAEHKAKGAKH